MANIIKPKRSESTGQTPTLSPGELAVNIVDKKVWVADSSGTPVLIVDGNASITETDPVFSASAAFSITTTDITNWNTAYGWGDHSAAGYLTTETDPVFTASTAAGITSTDTGNWNTAYGWGDHGAAGYLTTETDPVFSASTAAGITGTDTGNWNAAYGWGDHSTAGYLTTETDPTFTASAAYSITSTDTTNWNTAYGWGDHSVAGYLTTETDPVFTASDAAGITATDISNWNAKPDTVAVTSTGATITVTDNTVGGAVSFNVETPQGIATTDSPTFAGLTAAGLVYPAADGTSGQVIVTDGAGNLSFATVSVSVALDDLTDVTITTVSNNDFLKYNSTSSQWENVAISTDDISEGTTNLYFTDARARAAISAGTGISYNSTTGEISATGGGGTPGGSSGQLQWNNAGTLDGVGESTYYTSSTIALLLSQTTNTKTPLVITRNASPSADIFYWADSSLNINGGINSSGNMYFAYGFGASFRDSSGNEIVLTAPSSGSNWTMRLPAADGTNGQVLKTNGAGQLSFTDVITNLAGGSGGSIPYQSGASTTAMLANGTSGQILKANGGTSAPSWVAQSTLTVGNLTGGNSTTLLGSIPYQSNTNTTSLLSPNTTTTKKFLRQTGTGTNGAAPAWDTVTASDVGLGNVTNTAQVTSVTGTSPVASSGGTTPAISLASGYGDTQNPYASKTANYVLAAPNGLAGVPTFRALVAADIPTLNQNTTGSSGSCTGNSATATKSTNLIGGNSTTLLGALPYQSNTDTTSLLSPNTTTTKNFLSQTGTGTNGAAPSWSTVSKNDVGLGSVENTAISTWAGSSNITTLGTVGTGTWNATTIGLSKGGTNASITATNGGIVYSTASALAVSSAGTSGQILSSGGAGAPTWVSTVSGLTVTGLKETKTAPSISSGTLTLDCSVGNVFAVSLNANITTLSFTNVPATGTAYGLTLMLTADGTARTITWGSAVKWAGGTAPTLTSTNAKVDVFVLITHDGGTTWYAFTSGQNF